MGTMKTRLRRRRRTRHRSAGGMGRAIALAFAAPAPRSSSPTSTPPAGQETERLAREAGGIGRLRPHRRLRPRCRSQALVRPPVDRFGGLHCAVNAAAIENETAPAARMSTRHVRPHAGGQRPWRVPVHEVRDRGDARQRARHDGRGAIVNIASTNSFRPQPNQPAYTASKHAVIGLTRSAAIDYAGRASASTPSAPARSTRRCCATRCERGGATPRTSSTDSA